MLDMGLDEQRLYEEKPVETKGKFQGQIREGRQQTYP